VTRCGYPPGRGRGARGGRLRCAALCVRSSSLRATRLSRAEGRAP
jgi:hypothetical protein